MTDQIYFDVDSPNGQPLFEHLSSVFYLIVHLHKKYAKYDLMSKQKSE